MTMTPAEFKTAKIVRTPWSDERIRSELADHITNAETLEVRVTVPGASADRVRAIAHAGGWRTEDVRCWTDGVVVHYFVLVTGGSLAGVDLEMYRGTVLPIILPTAAEHHARVEGRTPLTRDEVVTLIDEAIAKALRDDDVPTVDARRHSAQLVIDVAAEHGWFTYLTRDGCLTNETYLQGRTAERVTLELHPERMVRDYAYVDPLVSTPSTLPLSSVPTINGTGCEVCGADWFMTPDGSACVNGHHPRHGWT